MPASEVRRGPASPEEQVASEQVSSLPALWRPGPQALVPLQEVLRGAALARRKQEPGLRGVLLVSTYESTGKRCLEPLMSRPLLPRSATSAPDTFSDTPFRPPDSGTDILGDSPRPLQQYRDYLEELWKREPTRLQSAEESLSSWAERNAMPIHDWTRVDAGLFHAFHQGWISALSCALNTGGLPPEYFALIEQATRHTLLDFLDLSLPAGHIEPIGKAAHGFAVALGDHRVTRRSTIKCRSRRDRPRHRRLPRRQPTARRRSSPGRARPG